MRLLGYRGNADAVVFQRSDEHIHEWDPSTNQVRLSELDALQSLPHMAVTTACYAPDGQAAVVVMGTLGPAFYARDSKSGRRFLECDETLVRVQRCKELRNKVLL
jgi:hypothetical protein